MIAPARRLAALIAGIIATMGITGGATADDLGAGPLPRVFEPAASVSLSATGRIDLVGVIDSPGPVTLVVRIDDAPAPVYADRANDERTLPPGPFALSLEAAQWRTSGGRALDVGHIHQVVVFLAGPGRAHLTKFALTGMAAAPGKALDKTRDKTLAKPPAQAPTNVPTRDQPGALRTGPLPLTFEPWRPADLSPGDVIRVEGTVAGAAPAAVALRIDDTGSTNYATRFNDERMIPPGPFRFAVGLGGLKTPSGRTLDPHAVARILVFAWQGTPAVTITRFAIEPGAAMPPGAHGYAFGALESALPAGFERIGPADPRLTGRGPITAIARPAPDPLVANGLRGVRRVVLPAPAARVRVTVWSEDPGEWDVLPHASTKRIQVNGHALIDETWTAERWITGRYLRGGAIEHTRADDAWTAYGARRGDARSIDVDARDGQIAIELSGSGAAAYYLGGVLIEPIAAQPPATTPGQAFVTAQRADWYRTHFPVAPPLPADAVAADTVALHSASPGAAPPWATLRLRAAPGTGVGIELTIGSDTPVARPRLTVRAPQRGAVTLGARLWAAQVRLERDDTVLRLRDNRLLADTSALPLGPDRPRGYELWIDVPDTAPPGVYAGTLTLQTEPASPAETAAIEITVLPVLLPAATKSAGFYLARAAHLSQFAGLTIERERQVQCDLDLLAGFGLTNTAPPVGGLEGRTLGTFAADMRRALASGVTPGWLIYNPLTELLASQGPERSAATAARLEALIRVQHLPEPLWSVADEPSNADQRRVDLAGWIAALRAHSPAIRLAGHLNTPRDAQFATILDTAIVNPGFGIDAPALARLGADGRHVWLYNTAAPRQTAGLWLWRTAAERYLQWHARLPTADPFDPLDGREADAQMIFPTANVCPRQPDIHRDLLRMAEGVVDQRWLLWLEAQTTPAAGRLLAEIRASLPGPFADAMRLDRAALEAIRDRIMAIAAKP